MISLAELDSILEKSIEGHQRAGTPYNLAGAQVLEALRDELQNVATENKTRKSETILPRTGT